jgi:hypothetical protein
MREKVLVVNPYNDPRYVGLVISLLHGGGKNPILWQQALSSESVATNIKTTNLVGPTRAEWKNKAEWWKIVATMYQLGRAFDIPAVRLRAVRLMTTATAALVARVNEQTKAGAAVNIGEETARGLVNGAQFAYKEGAQADHLIQRGYFQLSWNTGGDLMLDPHLRIYIAHAPAWPADVEATSASMMDLSDSDTEVEDADSDDDEVEVDEVEEDEDEDKDTEMEGYSTRS